MVVARSDTRIVAAGATMTTDGVVGVQRAPACCMRPVRKN
jgi:hypothetical protein